MWMGGDDLLAEGDFVWSDRTHLAFDNPVWKAGQPNNYGHIEHCLSIVARRFRLNDLKCSKRIPFICQIDM